MKPSPSRSPTAPAIRIWTASSGFSPIASTTRPEMKKAAATISNGISATSAQAGKGRRGVLIISSPLAGEGGPKGRMRGRTARRTPTPTRWYGLSSADRSFGRPKPSSYGADPSSGPIGRSLERPSFAGLWGHLPPQGGKGQRSPSSPRPSCRALADAGHQQAEVLGVGRLGAPLSGDAASAEHEDSVGQRENLVEFDGNQQHRLARVAQRDDAFVDEFDRADIDAARRLSHQDDGGIAVDLAREHDLLLVAAGEIGGLEQRRPRADVVGLHLRRLVRDDRPSVEQHALSIDRLLMKAEHRT